MDLATRLFQIRKTVLQMLSDRGYLVAQAQLEETKEDFKAHFTDSPRYSHDLHDMKRCIRCYDMFHWL